MYYDVLSFLSAESRILYYVRLYVFPFQCCYCFRLVGHLLSRLVYSSVYMYFVIHDYICILFTSSYISVVYIFIFSIVISFPLFILSLSFSLYLLDLSLTETVKQTYGQWLVYGEFNTLGFVSRPWLAYKLQGHYSWYQSSWFHSSKGYPVLVVEPV